MVPIPTEHQSQVTVIDWCNAHAHLHPALSRIFAIPNGSNKSIVAAMKFKREGLKPGVPDLFLPWQIADYGGAFIEMKRKGGSLSDAQIEWVDWLRVEAGYVVFVCWSADEAIQCIKNYLCLHDKKR